VTNTPSTHEQSSTASSSEPDVLRGLRLLFEALDRRGVRYCHWKSNARLAEALRGEGDVDLLVHRADSATFQSVLGALGYKPTRGGGASVGHHYGLDEASGRLLHLHVYHRVVTGGTVLKNHRLPVEDLLLSHTRRLHGVPVPDRAAELVLFVVRKMLEYATPVETLFLAREGSAVGEELAWLQAGVPEEAVSALLARHLPTLDPSLFRRCRDALASGSRVRRFLLARALASRLRVYACHPAPAAALLRGLRFARKVCRRALGRGPGDALVSGGAVIGVVGPDGAGKSTVVQGTARWLGECLPVAAIHAGKPPATLATAAPHFTLPLLRRLLPRYRAIAIEADGDAPRPHGPEQLREGRLFLLYPLRAVMLAHERRRLLLRAHRRAARGALVLSDRYPTTQVGVPEGPAASFLLDDANPVYRWLARLEERIYRSIPPADLILRLEVPVDLACHRNLTRDKVGGPKPTGYIRRRHEQTVDLQFPGARVEPVSTAIGVEDTLRAVREIVWTAL